MKDLSLRIVLNEVDSSLLNTSTLSQASWQGTAGLVMITQLLPLETLDEDNAWLENFLPLRNSFPALTYLKSTQRKATRGVAISGFAAQQRGNVLTLRSQQLTPQTGMARVLVTFVLQ